MMLIFLLIAFEALGSIGFAVFLLRKRKNWSKNRVALMAASPIPLLILAPCAYVAGDAAFASPQQCGVDACAMAIMAGMYGAAAALVLYLIGIVVSAVTVRLRKDEQIDDVADVFS